MKQLRFTTTPPHSMFSDASGVLVKPKDVGEFTCTKIKGGTAYIHGDAEKLAGFDIPVLIDGDLGQLDLPKEEQDILMLLPSGEYPCVAEYVDRPLSKNCYFLTLKNKEEKESDLTITTKNNIKIQGRLIETYSRGKLWYAQNRIVITDLENKEIDHIDVIELVCQIRPIEFFPLKDTHLDYNIED